MSDQTQKRFLPPAGHSGMVLIASIMLIVFASIAVLGVSTFVIARLQQAESQRLSALNIYLAQAGIQQAVYDFRFHDLTANGYFTKGQTNLDPSRFFVLGGTAADVLMANTATAALGGAGQRDLVNVSIQNATNSSTLTINRILVTWNNAVNLRNIRINGSTLWTGNQGSPVSAILAPPFTLDTTPSVYQIDYFRFQSNMTGATVTAQFFMTDGTSKTVAVYPASNNSNFNIIAMGKTTASNIYRTIQVTYNALTGHIIASEETNVVLP